MSKTYSDKYGRKSLGKNWGLTTPEAEPGFSLWVESGEWITAPTVDAQKFGGHDYDNGGYKQGVRDCKCGAYMLSSSSAGPVDPFGACPENPRSDNKPDPSAPETIWIRAGDAEWHSSDLSFDECVEYRRVSPVSAATDAIEEVLTYPLTSDADTLLVARAQLSELKNRTVSPVEQNAEQVIYLRGLNDAAEAMCFACGNFQYKPAAMGTKGEYVGRWVHRDHDDGARTYCYAGVIRTMIALAPTAPLSLNQEEQERK